MQRKLQLLDSFQAIGSDGGTYKVCAYEHLVQDDTVLIDGLEHWESTGEAEYRLADGRRIDLGRDGAMLVHGTGVRLLLQ